MILKILSYVLVAALSASFGALLMTVFLINRKQP